MKPIQVTDQITLELLRLEHTPEQLDLINANRLYLRQWLPWLDKNRSISDQEENTQSTIEQNEQGLGPHFIILFEAKMCGRIGFHPIDPLNRNAVIGYWLAESHTGRGIMTTVTKEILRIGFQEYGLHKIEIRCAQHNYKSRAIPERLGFKYEATLREAEWLYDHFVDHAIYSMVESEFNNQSGLQTAEN